MRKVEHRMRLDLLKGGNQGYIRVKRGENGARRLTIALYMNSVPYISDSGTTVTFRAVKPDETKLFNAAAIQDNIVTVALTTQTVAALGTVKCELTMYGENNEVLYSPQFDIVVEDYLYSDNAIESTDEYTELTETLSEAKTLIAEAETLRDGLADIDAKEAARQSNEWQRNSAEAARVSGENARASSESARRTAETARSEAETARASAETARANAESARASAESARVSQENARAQAETQRVNNETQRKSAETARASAESTRSSQESGRISAESARVTAEKARVTAENARVAAEQTRQTNMNKWENATANSKTGSPAGVVLSEKNGHKNFEFTLPLGGGSDDAVLYTAQSLTDAQKQQARSNIAAVDSTDLEKLQTISIEDSGSYFGTSPTVESALQKLGWRVNTVRTFLVTLTYSYSSGYTCDKTYNEILAAYEAKKRVMLSVLNTPFAMGASVMLPLFAVCEDGAVIFSSTGVMSDRYINTNVTFICSAGNTWEEFWEPRPTSLKNPNALTFTGGVTGSYDGSAAKTVNIPTALKNPNALTITVDGTANSYDGSEAKDIEISTAAKYDKPLRFTDISVPVIRFTADTTYSDYPYAGVVILASAEIDTTMIPDVVFGLSDAVSGNFAPIAESYVNGQVRGVRIFAKTKPTAAVTIKTLTLWRAV